jgi:hypothetical protein
MSEFKCGYCKKSFKREKSLLSHMCTKKQRMNDADTSQSRIGFVCYERFMRSCSAANRNKQYTFEEFINSNLYMEFIKFSRFTIERDVISPIDYLDFLIKKGTASKYWKSERSYQAYLKLYLGKEPIQKALERTFITMQEWADANGQEWDQFFELVNPIELTHIIRSGNLSPWVLYLSEAAGRAMDKLSSEQGEMIADVIDPQLWHKRFTAKADDLGFAQEVIGAAGL